MTESDWLDSPQFKALIADYWCTSLYKFQKIDELRAAIRANYRKRSADTELRRLRARVRQLERFVEVLAPKKERSEVGVTTVDKEHGEGM